MATDHYSLCWLVCLKDPSGCFDRWSLRRQEFDTTIAYKHGPKHGDADCLPRATVESPPASTDDEEDEGFLGVVKGADMAGLQREDCELRAVIKQLGGQGSDLPLAFCFPRLPKLRHLTGCSLQK